MDVVEIDSRRIAFERTGSGPPIVLLHGYVGDGPTVWRNQLEGLSDTFTVVAWDAPGAGRSSDPPESFGMAGYADCLASFIHFLGLVNPHVVGLSFGGALAIEFCRRHPDAAASLTLAGAYAGWAGSLAAAEVDRRLAQALELSNLSPAAFVDALLPTMFSAGTPEDAIEGFRAAMGAFHPAGFRAMARASAEDLRPALPHVTVPTLLLYGANDVRAPRAVAEDLHEAIPGSRLVLLPGAGHVCNVESPQAFNDAVRRFLSDVSS
jgi:pimeloyl-ACP methyl ester carboxylesterase